MLCRGSSSSRHRSRRGFTLVEVLVTMGLMGIVIPVTMRTISSSIAMASLTKHKAEAVSLAQSRLQVILSDMALLGDPSVANSSGDCGIEWPEYEWTSQSEYDAQLGLTRITVSVRWSQRGQPASVDLSTMVADIPEPVVP